MPELDDLEGDAAADRLLLLGHVDDAAAALADLLQQLVAADPQVPVRRTGGGRKAGQCRASCTRAVG
jgi:phage tail sheath gpL-like